MGAISIENVSFSYADDLPKGADERTGNVLSNLYLEIPDGQFLCLIGHSGSGKSTLLRLLVGLSQPTKGKIEIDGAPVTGTSLNRSVVFQNYSLFPWMKVRQNVAFGIEQANKELARGLSRSEVEAIANDYLERVGMLEAADKYPYQLSGGMQQRVAIARALAMDTEIVLFDEPFGALDVKSRRSLQTLVDELWRSGERRKTMVFVTHDISEAVLLADRVIFMSHGNITADLPIDIERPRSVSDTMRLPEAIALREQLTALFYEDGECAGADGGEESIDVLFEGLQEA